MSILFVLMAASLLVAGSFLALFVWASRNGQFEDSKTPPMRMVADGDDEGSVKKEKEKGIE